MINPDCFRVSARSCIARVMAPHRSLEGGGGASGTIDKGPLRGQNIILNVELPLAARAVDLPIGCLCALRIIILGKDDCPDMSRRGFSNWLLMYNLYNPNN